eukprot:6032471-Pleurochrysis_carterae.AAC.1
MEVESKERAYIEAWIRDLRSGMEGSKGSGTSDVWHTARMPVGKRYQQYCDERICAKLPVVGSRSLFEK